MAETKKTEAKTDEKVATAVKSVDLTEVTVVRPTSTGSIIVGGVRYPFARGTKTKIPTFMVSKLRLNGHIR